MLDKLKNIMEMQKKAKEIKTTLEATVFDTASADGSVKISMNGSQQVEAVTLKCEGLEGAVKTQLEKAIKDTYNRAIKHSHEIAAQKMKDIVGLNLPGMF